jgi:hypothetical protein
LHKKSGFWWEVAFLSNNIIDNSLVFQKKHYFCSLNRFDSNEIFILKIKKIMSAQQIKLNINDLVNRIEDEDRLQACYIVIATIAKDYEKQPKPKAAKPRTVKKTKATLSPINDGVEPFAETGGRVEKVLPHDLSLVFLANELFKNSQPLPEEAILAFDDALSASALKIPTLPNRL